ncbi:Hypothetical predicted protein [Octopus vulgaris]|uniref:NADP-dependent oxidoreductase domain-containing protein n=1 Tax=Octopus vulgaris TaxID=6645 RepID=A0AA36BXM5_OCTVU|nr:Hypothetical predicted protein [Octopus vulgaris]
MVLNVDYNYLGSSGMKVSNICFGALTFGATDEKSHRPGQLDPTGSYQLLDRFAECGGNFIDTADVYTNRQSETIVGNWLSSKERSRYVIATKVRVNTNPNDPTDVNAVGLSRKHIVAGLEKSLECLQTNYVDLYQFLLPKTPVPSSKTPVPSPETPVPSPETPVLSLETPVPSPETPVPSPETPVPSPKTPVPSPKNPVSSPTNPVSSPKTPVPSPKTPVPSPKTPVPSPKTPVPSPKTHILSPKTPVPSPKTPILSPKTHIPAGKIHHIGVSNFCGWQLQKTVDLANSIGMSSILTLQQQYSLMERNAEFEEFQVCQNDGISILPWSPLKGGFLSGKFKRTEAPSAESRIGYTALDEKNRVLETQPGWSTLQSRDDIWLLLDAMKKIAQNHNKSVAQVAIRWLLQRKMVASVIIGAKTMYQLDDNLGASSGWELTCEEMKTLNDLSAPEEKYPYSFIRRFNDTR